ncbi:MAG: hypothetical protein M1133_15735 [Armatimonadetes bacterium]|nr:hypothetical protein [Armatimonadota bacterium]
MDKLFKVKTVGELVTRPGRFGTQGGVCIHWFHVGRTEPAFPYHETVPGWDDMMHSEDPTQLSPNLARRFAAYVDQLFTREELEQVEERLRVRSSKIDIEEIDLPVTHFEVPYAAIPPEPEAGEGYGLVTLPAACGSLPFKVMGYFDLVYETAFQRFEIAVVKSLVEKAGLRPDPAQETQEQTQALSNSLADLQSALQKLQQSLDTLNRHLSSGGEM